VPSSGHNRYVESQTRKWKHVPSRTLVSIYQTIRQYILEGCNLELTVFFVRRNVKRERKENGRSELNRKCPLSS
jgi:hypothetical protein